MQKSLLAFNLSIPPHYIKQETYIPILCCMKCYLHLRRLRNKRLQKSQKTLRFAQLTVRKDTSGINTKGKKCINNREQHSTPRYVAQSHNICSLNHKVPSQLIKTASESTIVLSISITNTYKTQTLMKRSWRNFLNWITYLQSKFQKPTDSEKSLGLPTPANSKFCHNCIWNIAMRD